MKKVILETFIRKYSLGSLINMTKWKYTFAEKKLHARAAADGTAFLTDVMTVDMPDFNTEDVVLCIGNTDKVKAMLSPFGEDITVTINKNGDRIMGFNMSNADVECYCPCADATAIPPMPKSLASVDYDVVIPITEEFSKLFLKSAAILLDDVANFSVGMNSKGVFEIVIGYASTNSNRIRITPTMDSVKNTLKMAMSFPIKNVIQVLKANSDIENGTMSINCDAGLLQMYFKDDRYTCSYYQMANKK